MKSIKHRFLYRKLVQCANRFFPVAVCKMRFRRMFGRKMNLRDPQDINEKISWLELYSDTSLWTLCTDKYRVREFVKEKGLENILVELLGVWDDAKEIEWETLPKEFVLKTNNGSGTVLVVRDKSKLDIPKTITLFNRYLQQYQYPSTTEFHYQGIKPCIIAEELLHVSDDERTWTNSIIDYKCWCFNGKLDSIWTCTNRDKNGTDVALFTKEWDYRPEASIFNSHYRKQNHLVPRPACLDEMIKVAETLSQPFPVVRVDLYVINDKVYFGELTFTSLGGTMNFYTEEELLRMGHEIDLSTVKKIKR